MNKSQPALKREFKNPLFVIAGLPSGVTESVVGHLKKTSPYNNYQYLPLPGAQGDEIYSKETAEGGLKSICDLVARKYDGGNKISPSRIVLLYASGAKADKFLEYFDFFCYCEKINLQSSGNNQSRNNLTLIQENIKNQIQYIQSANSILKRIEDEVCSRRKRTCLLLPPNNYKIDGGHCIGYYYAMIRSNELDIDRLPNKLSSKTFNSSNLPRFLSGKSKIVSYIDSRDLVFPPCKDDENHGRMRAMDEVVGVGKIKMALNQLYRFGIPIFDGFHYDVQRENGHSLKNIEFQCVTGGSIVADVSHVNIYPNDFVRK